MSDSRAQELIRFVEKRVPNLKGNEFLSFKLSEDKKYVVASAEVDFDDDCGVYLCYTINNGDIFMSVTDGDPKQVALLMSFMKFSSEESASISFGHSLTIPDSSYLEKNGRCGAVFLVPSTLPLLSSLPNEFSYNGVTSKIFLAVFLDEEEMKVKTHRGFDELLDNFSERSRDIIRISSSVH